MAADWLSEAATIRLVLVTRPRSSARAEVARTSIELAGIGIKKQHLAINGMMPEETAGDPLALAVLKRDKNALRVRRPKSQPCRAVFALHSENHVGLAALKRFAANAPDTFDASEPNAMSLEDFPTLGALVDDIDNPGKGLIMFTGKGDVRKTTMAAAASELPQGA